MSHSVYIQVSVDVDLRGFFDRLDSTLFTEHKNKHTYKELRRVNKSEQTTFDVMFCGADAVKLRSR